MNDHFINLPFIHNSSSLNQPLDRARAANYVFEQIELRYAAKTCVSILRITELRVDQFGRAEKTAHAFTHMRAHRSHNPPTRAHAMAISREELAFFIAFVSAVFRVSVKTKPLWSRTERKHSKNSHLIIHFPTSSGVSE